MFARRGFGLGCIEIERGILIYLNIQEEEDFFPEIVQLYCRRRTDKIKYNWRLEATGYTGYIESENPGTDNRLLTTYYRTVQNLPILYNKRFTMLILYSV